MTYGSLKKISNIFFRFPRISFPRAIVVSTLIHIIILLLFLIAAPFKPDDKSGNDGLKYVNVKIGDIKFRSKAEAHQKPQIAAAATAPSPTPTAVQPSASQPAKLPTPELHKNKETPHLIKPKVPNAIKQRNILHKTPTIITKKPTNIAKRESRSTPPTPPPLGKPTRTRVLPFVLVEPVEATSPTTKKTALAAQKQPSRPVQTAQATPTKDPTPTITKPRPTSANSQTKPLPLYSAPSTGKHKRTLTGARGDKRGSERISKEETYSSHGKRLSGWVKRHRYYPKSAFSQNIEGSGILYLVLDKHGTIHSYLVEKSTGNTLLDEAIRETVRRAIAADGKAPVPNSAASAKNSSRFSYRIPIEFNISNKPSLPEGFLR